MVHGRVSHWHDGKVPAASNMALAPESAGALPVPATFTVAVTAPLDSASGVHWHRDLEFKWPRACRTGPPGHWKVVLGAQ